MFKIESTIKDRPKRIQYIPPSLSSDKEVENSQFVQKGKNFNKYNDVDVSCTGPGSEQVKFIEDFRKSKLNDTILARLKSLDFQTPTPVQKASIPVKLKSKSTKTKILLGDDARQGHHGLRADGLRQDGCLSSANSERPYGPGH